MALKRIALVVVFISFGIFWLASQTLAGSSEPVYLRLNWKPGQVFKYKVDMRSEAKALGESAELRLAFDVALRVLKVGNKKDGEFTGGGYQHVAEPGAFALGGRMFEVALEHGDLGLTMNVNGVRLQIDVGRENVRASVNGRSLASHELADLRRDAKPLQEILKAPISLLLTDSGRIVRVSGLQDLDAATQRELAMGFLEEMLLPPEPMKVGDQFVQTRGLESLFPTQPGQENPMAGKSVRIVSTLDDVRRDGSGRVLAEFTSPLKKTFYSVPMPDFGTNGTIEADMIYNTVYDVESGNIVKETTNGTILMRPKGGNVPGLIKVEVNGTISLVEVQEFRLTAHEF